METALAPLEFPPEQEIVVFVWNDKYRFKKPDGTSDEKSIEDTHLRVINGVYEIDPNAEARSDALSAMVQQEWNPGGRIHAGAGTGRKVTLINCYVNGTMHDSMPGIMQGVTNAALTQQQGGGIGTDFSPLRPAGAVVRATGSVSSGPIPFADMFNAMCLTVKSSGSRRGAMMFTIIITHPDVYRPKKDYPDVIHVKQEQGRLENFNMSVLVTQAFMEQLKAEGTWDLGFGVPPADPKELLETKQVDGKPWYVYNRVPAAEVWDKILRSTYEYAEPGVIFIDRINEMNNLWYCEHIQCTNPCGEQPLPPHGDCDLGAVNLAKMVRNPFTDKAAIDYELIAKTATIGMRFLDNVLDVTKFPLPDQKDEALSKRRTGLGVTGLGTLLQMCQIRYGSSAALTLTGQIMQCVRDAAYRASIELAKERGPFPLFDKDKFLKGKFIQTLPKDIQEGIAKHGIRNGVLLTIAPVGTGSVYYGNVTSGLEPMIFLEGFRKVLMPDGTRKVFKVEDYGWRLWKHLRGHPPDLDPKSIPLPEYFCSATDLSVEAHLQTQAVCQKYIDSSISKTINCPETMSFDDFKAVYSRAYELGLKGCTTYRPSGVRGSVLSASNPEAKQEKEESRVIARPEFLPGGTYCIPDGHEGKLYVTVNHHSGKVLEFFLRENSGNEWIELVGRLGSLLLRSNVPIKEIRQQLRRVGGQSTIYYNEKRFTSAVQALDEVIFEQAARHYQSVAQDSKDPIVELVTKGKPNGSSRVAGPRCPTCAGPMVAAEGCLTCIECGFSKCA